MAKKTISIDFDGVIHGYQSGWRGAGVCPDPVVPGAIEFVRAALVRFDVAVYSTRAETVAGALAIREYLRRHGLSDAELQALRITSGKPKAVLYIDDRGYQFAGQFPSLDFVDSFKPYRSEG